MQYAGPWCEIHWVHDWSAVDPRVVQCSLQFFCVFRIVVNCNLTEFIQCKKIVKFGIVDDSVCVCVSV